ncbi:hypothetical protein HPP92_000207 [Vanilla planifolia]|uniref:Uncharacterized protein n=1 Tax=Vanilla planifolia TaxID=51239 RepID=A0A835RX25_VANPL|nr:hypothetical protein HPP92_000147 [Vanilla planifolia]KAG0500135.1 hypothetical protein HPP92_000207 [Vanilla planifolia]
MLGMGSALETLCGQSYGAMQYHSLGIYMQRAVFVLLLVCFPVTVLWGYTSQILIAFGQDHAISIEAGLYVRWLVPALFAYGILQCQMRFLQTQNIGSPLLVSSGVTALIHLLVCWLLVFKYGLGSKGTALATSISYWTNVALLALYIRFSPSCKKTWTGFKREAFGGSMDFIKLALPSSIMLCIEFWSFELIVLLSGLLPNPKLETSVLSISLNTTGLMFMIPYGLGAAISTRVSNELGAGRPEAARLAVIVVVIVTMLESLVVGICILLARNIWGYVYSNEDQVVKYIIVMVPILAISNVFDGIQCVLSGITRGCGLQKAGAVANIVAYYVVGVPSSVIFAFLLHIGGKGLWEKEASKAGERVNCSSIAS